MLRKMLRLGKGENGDIAESATSLSLGEARALRVLNAVGSCFPSADDGVRPDVASAPMWDVASEYADRG